MKWFDKPQLTYIYNASELLALGLGSSDVSYLETQMLLVFDPSANLYSNVHDLALNPWDCETYFSKTYLITAVGVYSV